MEWNSVELFRNDEYGTSYSYAENIVAHLNECNSNWFKSILILFHFALAKTEI